MWPRSRLRLDQCQIFPKSSQSLLCYGCWHNSAIDMGGSSNDSSPQCLTVSVTVTSVNHQTEQWTHWIIQNNIHGLKTDLHCTQLWKIKTANASEEGKVKCHSKFRQNCQIFLTTKMNQRPLQDHHKHAAYTTQTTVKDCCQQLTDHLTWRNTQLRDAWREADKSQQMNLKLIFNSETARASHTKTRSLLTACSLFSELKQVKSILIRLEIN